MMGCACLAKTATSRSTSIYMHAVQPSLQAHWTASYMQLGMGYIVHYTRRLHHEAFMFQLLRTSDSFGNYQVTGV
jgi:hypothetical protein